VGSTLVVEIAAPGRGGGAPVNEIFVVGGPAPSPSPWSARLTYLAFLRKAGPNEVIVVSGRGRVTFITGGADMVVPLFHTWNRLSLEVMTLDVTTPEVYTSQGVPVIVDGVAQIKIKKDEASLHAAAERFLGKNPEEIAKIALETVQGHLRAILGTLSVEDIYKNRDQFAQKVQEISAGASPTWASGSTPSPSATSATSTAISRRSASRASPR
jgi:hypothetical protein